MIDNPVYELIISLEDDVDCLFIYKNDKGKKKSRIVSSDWVDQTHFYNMNVMRWKPMISSIGRNDILVVIECR